MRGLVEQPIAHKDNLGVPVAVSESAPLPVRIPAGNYIQTGAPAIAKWSYNGTVAAGQSARFDGQASGNPTISGAIGYKQLLIAIQHRMSAAAQSGNSVQVRRRYTTSDGVPYTTWSTAQTITFNSGTTDALTIIDVIDASNPRADQFELAVANAAATANDLIWQAVVIAVMG